MYYNLLIKDFTVFSPIDLLYWSPVSTTWSLFVFLTLNEGVPIKLFYSETIKYSEFDSKLKADLTQKSPDDLRMFFKTKEKFSEKQFSDIFFSFFFEILFLKFFYQKFFTLQYQLEHKIMILEDLISR